MIAPSGGLARQPVEQFGVRRPTAVEAEVARRLDQAAAEVPAPYAVHHDPPPAAGSRTRRSTGHFNRRCPSGLSTARPHSGEGLAMTDSPPAPWRLAFLVHVAAQRTNVGSAGDPWLLLHQRRRAARPTLAVLPDNSASACSRRRRCASSSSQDLVKEGARHAEARYDAATSCTVQGAARTEAGSLLNVDRGGGCRYPLRCGAEPNRMWPSPGGEAEAQGAPNRGCRSRPVKGTAHCGRGRCCLSAA